jgi:hypothetical protein
VLVLAGVDPGLRATVCDEAEPLGGTVEVGGPGDGTATITARFPCA